MTNHLLNVRYCFGINPSSCSNVLTIDDHQLAYICGAQVVLLNTETKDQTFIAGGKFGISNIYHSPRRVLAVADRGDPAAVVSLYDSVTLRKKKVLSYPELGSSEVRSMSLSEDGKLCVVQGGAPDWNLALWNIEKSAKVMSVVRVPVVEDAAVTQVSFCPWDASVVIALGRGIFKLFRISEGQIRPATLMVRRESSNFLAHCWLGSHGSSALVVGTETGEVLLIENLEFRAVLFPSPGEAPVAAPIHAFALTSAGALLAGSTNGTIRYFTRNAASKELYQFAGSYHLRDVDASILSIAMNDDDSFSVATSAQQLLACSINHLNAAKDSSAEAELLVTAFHGPGRSLKSAVTGLDVARWRNVLASCGRDRTVRVWSLADRRVEVSKRFEDEPHSLSLHPSGIYLAVGFEDRVRLLVVLERDLFVAKDLVVRGCSLVRFSPGGQYFAVAAGILLQVYGTYTTQLVCTLKAHLAEVVSLSWTSLDSRLVSVGVDGAIYTWNVAQGARCKEEYPTTASYAGGAASHDGALLFCPLNDRRMRVITTERSPLFSQQQQQQAGSFSSASLSAGQGQEGGQAAVRAALRKFDAHDVELPRRVRCLLLDETRRLLFLGSVDAGRSGAVLVGSLASLTASAAGNTYFESCEVAASAISCMALSYDGLTLFTGDESGCICVCDVEVGTGGGVSSASTASTGTVASRRRTQRAAAGRDSEDGEEAAGGGGRQLSPFELTDEALIHLEDLESGRRTIAKLEESLRELVLSNLYQLNSREMEHGEQVRELSDKFTEQLRGEAVKFEMLEEERLELEYNYAKRTAEEQAAGAAEMAALEAKYAGKVRAETARFESLLADMEAAERQWDAENAMLLATQEARVAEAVAEYEGKLVGERERQQQVRREAAAWRADCERRRAGLEDDADAEALTTRSQFEERLSQETRAADQLVEMYGAAKKELLVLQKELEGQREEVKKLREKEGRLLETVRSLEKDIQGQKREIREREETVTDKEKRIFDLKKKNQELEKFRFVLDYKIKELKAQIAPREAEIAAMRKQIEEMDLELEQYHKSHQALAMMIAELELKYEGLRGEHHQQAARLQRSRGVQRRMLRDLSSLRAVKHDKLLLKAKFVDIFRQYAQTGDGGGDETAAAAATQGRLTEDDPRVLYNRDREQMERNLESVRRALKTDSSAHRRDLEKMMRENVVLTRELNELRRDHHEMQLQKAAVDAASAKGLQHADLGALMELLGIAPPGTGSNNASKGSTLNKGRGGGTASAEGQGGAVWRELEMQRAQMLTLERDLVSTASSVGVDLASALARVDREVAAKLSTKYSATSA